MSMKATTQTYFYDATILRNDQRARRQGTIGATSPSEAMDLIQSMADLRWKRPLVKVELYLNKLEGEIELVMTSTIGEAHAKARVESPPNNEQVQKKLDQLTEEDDDDFTEYGIYGSYFKDSAPSFYPSSVGAMYTEETFAILKLQEDL